MVFQCVRILTINSPVQAGNEGLDQDDGTDNRRKRREKVKNS